MFIFIFIVIYFIGTSIAEPRPAVGSCESQEDLVLVTGLFCLSNPRTTFLSAFFCQANHETFHRLRGTVAHLLLRRAQTGSSGSGSATGSYDSSVTSSYDSSVTNSKQPTARS